MNHQLKIIFANFKKSKFTFLLNIVGLTCAFTSFILIMMYVWTEYNFDQYHTDAEDIYRLEYKSPYEGKYSVFMSGPTGKLLVDELSDIEYSTIYLPWGKWKEEPFTYETPSGIQKSYEDFSYADKNLTNVFTFNIISGKQHPFKSPGNAMINKSFAEKAFGNDNPIGKLLTVNGDTYTITSVFKDLPENSIFTSCPIILSIPTHGYIANTIEKWGIVNFPQFIKVKHGTDFDTLNKKINELSIIKEKYNFYDDGKTPAMINARPIRKLHFTDEVNENPLFLTNNKMYVDSLLIVGILILLVALINYINFSTAKLPIRLKTFSINRVIGGNKWSSAIQLMSETLIIFILAFCMAGFISYLLNKTLSLNILGYQLSFNQNHNILVVSGLIALFTALIAGAYPALLSTKAKPVESLKRVNKGGMSENFRAGLTVFQFAATIALIIASITVLKQVSFMQQTDLGFNKSNTIVIQMNSNLRENFSSFKNELKNNPNIIEVACSGAVPGRSEETTSFKVDGQICHVWNWAVGDDYMKMMDFKILEGRDFINNSEAEEGNFICNETAAKKYGWKVGTKIYDNQIVGIMKDFNMVSLRETVEPFVFHKSNSADDFRVISVKLSGSNNATTWNKVKHTFNTFCPDVPFRGFYLDDNLNLLYKKENQQSGLLTSLGLLSIIISMMGILGLSIFMCQQKIKEIGIRKVNGAKTYEVLLMLNKNFIKWVAIAFVIASPLTWFIMNRWLESFAFQTSISWWIFVLAGIISLSIALITVSWQSWRAATRNPVEALRYE